MRSRIKAEFCDQEDASSSGDPLEFSLSTQTPRQGAACYVNRLDEVEV